MEAALATVVMAREPTEPWGAKVEGEPPHVELEPLTRDELEAFHGGEREADELELHLVWAARTRGALDVRLAEGLHALRKGERLAELGFHLDDYAREVLDLGERAAKDLAKLGCQLATRPMLRAAMEAGRVHLRAAQTVARVATGEAEAAWVERAARDTVRELAVQVRDEGGVPPENAEEDWLRLRAHLPPDERAVVDDALRCAARELPGSTPFEQWEALAQEWLGGFSRDPGEDDDRRPLGSSFRLLGPGEQERRARLEGELERWAHLPAVLPCSAPDVRFENTDSADAIDAKLRRLAKLRSQLDEVIGWCAHAIRRTGFHRRLGFTSFRHYVEERLGVALPRRVAVLLAAAVENVRGLFGRLLPVGRCLALVAAHFFDVWSFVLKRRKTRSQRIRERDVWCLVPGCSRPMDDAHHLEFRSRGGTDDGKNLAADCKFHHLRVIHGGHLVAFGEAPHAITWLRKGKPFTGTAED